MFNVLFLCPLIFCQTKMNMSLKMCDYVERHGMNNDSKDCTLSDVSTLMSIIVTSVVSLRLCV